MADQEKVWSHSCALTETKCTACQGRRRAFQETTWGNMNCLELSRSGYECDITTCREKCILEEHKHVCGPAYCAADSATCGFKVANMVATVAEAAFTTATLVFTFGGSAVPALSRSSAKRLSQTVSSKVIKQTMAKAKRMLPAIKQRALKEIRGDLAENFADGVSTNIINNAVTALLAAVDKKGQEAGDFDPASLDPTGVAAAVDTMEGGSVADQTTAWLSVFSIVDPSGWVSAAASFVANACSPGFPLEWQGPDNVRYCLHSHGINQMISRQKCDDSEKQKFLVPEHEDGMGTIRLASDTTQCLRVDDTRSKWVLLKSCNEEDRNQLFIVKGSTGRRRGAQTVQPDAQEVKVYHAGFPGYCLNADQYGAHPYMAGCSVAPKLWVPERDFR